MILGQPFGFSSFANPITLLQFVPIAWNEVCPPSVGIEAADVADDPGFVQIVDQLWIEQNPATAGTIIKRC